LGNLAKPGVTATKKACGTTTECISQFFSGTVEFAVMQFWSHLGAEETETLHKRDDAAESDAGRRLPALSD